MLQDLHRIHYSNFLIKNQHKNSTLVNNFCQLHNFPSKYGKNPKNTQFCAISFRFVFWCIYNGELS